MKRVAYFLALLLLGGLVLWLIDRGSPKVEPPKKLSRSVTIDIDSIPMANGFGPGDEATHILFTMDNTLIADHSGVGGAASIRKRDFDATLITINSTFVPEPTTALLLMGGLAGLASRRGKN